MSAARQFPLVRICGSLICIIAVVAIAGHIGHKPNLYTWGNTGNLSLPAAVAFTFTGWAIFVLGKERGERYAETHGEL